MQCQKHGIPPPTSFAYPGNAITRNALPVLKEHGIKFARRGGAPEYPYQEGRGFAYEPGLDHALLVPSAGDARPGSGQRSVRTIQSTKAAHCHRSSAPGCQQM